MDKIINEHVGYIITPDIGYPTPGSLGTYGFNDHHIPTLTYELEKGINQTEIIDKHVPALIKALGACDIKFEDK